MSALIHLCHLGKSYAGVVALQDVDLALKAGSIHALVGENGAGKSTLINILSGFLQPDCGEIRLGSQPVRIKDAHAAQALGIVTVHQEVDLFPSLTIAENLGLEQGLVTRWPGLINWREQRRRAGQALQEIGVAISPATLAGHLPPGQRQLVEIAAALSQPCRVLILDEPTSSLSGKETLLLFEHLRRYRSQGKAILYVSHRLEEIFTLADEVSVLRDGRHVWTGAIRDCSPARVIRMMVGREPLTPGPVTRGSPLRGERGGRNLFQCRGLTAFDGSFTDISLEVRVGEVLGLYGLIGAGRTEFAQGVFGLRPLAGGEILINGESISCETGVMIGRKLAYVPEDRLRQGLCRDLSVRANVVLASLQRLARWLWLPVGREKQVTRSAVEQLGIKLNSIEQPVGTLSGGNQQKVVLGRWLACEPDILILDEPTRGVDVGAKAEIYVLIQRLAGEGKAILFISSDLPEILSQTDRVGVFREGRLAGFFDPKKASADDIATAALPIGEASRKGINRHGLSLAFLREGALATILLVIFAFLHYRTGDFLGPNNLRQLALDTALLSFCAVGAALVLLAGGLDISLGALMALSAGMAGRLWEQDRPFPLVAVTALGIGAAGGFLNASLALLGRVHPIVVTLGTLSLYRGLTLYLIEENVLVPGSDRNWLLARFLEVPLIVWLAFLLVIVSWIFLSRTVAGREFHALGDNPWAAHRVGIHKHKVWLKAFTLQGLLVGAAGLLSLANSGSMQPTDFEDRTLEAIAAAVVGGVAITGGRGSAWGVVLGCLFLVSLPRASIFLHIPTQWQRALVGSALLIAVTMDTLWRKNQKQ